MAISRDKDMKVKGNLPKNTPPIVSPHEWEAAWQQLLVKEKALTRARDAMAAERRRMPWMPVEKKYEFEGPNGRVRLLDLFEGRTQLIIYRAFFEPGVFGWPEHACRGCSLGADQVSNLAHLNARDTTLVYVSPSPQADIARLKARMGWDLAIEVTLPPDVHVYAPGAQGYKPVVVQLDSTPELKLGPVLYPEPQTLFLPAINEKMPVFSGTFKLGQQVTVSVAPEFMSSLRGNGAGKALSLSGTLFYQACDETKCFLPEKIPLSWQFTGRAARPATGLREHQAFGRVIAFGILSYVRCRNFLPSPVPNWNQTTDEREPS